MDQRATSSSARDQLPLKRLAPAELRRLIDLAFVSPDRASVTVTWADGRQAHATDEPGFDNLGNYPKTDIVRIDVDYADGSHLVYAPASSVVTATGHDGDEAFARARNLRDQYEAIPNRRAAVVIAKVILRVSLITIFVSSAMFFLHLAANLSANYRIALLVLWVVVVVGCGTWSEYLEWRVDPARTLRLRSRSRWYSQPAVVVATMSALTATVLVAATVFERLHR
jgi:hypothetical protein